MQLSIWDCIEQYKALREREPDIAQVYFRLIENEGKRLFRLHHVSWDKKAEDLLLSAVEYFHVSLGVSFSCYLLAGMRNVYNLGTDPDDFYSSGGFQGVGLSKFRHTQTSCPERLVLEKEGPTDSQYSDN